MINENESIESLLIGDYKIVQDNTLYKFTSDSVVLSRFAECKKGESVADVCSGSGIVGIHFYALNSERVKDAVLFELQDELAALSEKSILLNGLQDKFSVVRGKLQEKCEDFKERFSLILCNPPYKKKNSGEQSLKREIALCRHEIEITQREICRSVYKMLKRGGRFCICQRVERLAELFIDLKEENLNPCKMQLVVAKNSQKPYLVLIEAVKGVNRPFKVLPDYVN